MDRFLAHERALLEATVATSHHTIREALRLDPMVPAGQVEALTRELLRSSADS